MRAVVAVLICTVAVLASVATAAQPPFTKPPRGCPVVRPHAGKTSGDFEVVFGQRRLRSRAVVLLRTVRRKGFRCAVIENEQHTHEVAVIGLRNWSSAHKIMRRAHRKGLAAYLVQS
jgi:cell division septation protein DedD